MDGGTKITAALLKASAKLHNAPFDSVNPFHKSKYASLASVLATVRPVLAEVGIVVIQPIHGRTVETRLIHESGESITSETEVILPEGAKPQEYGSALTYARRYGLTSIVSICGEEDDDAEGAEKRNGKKDAALAGMPADARETFNRPAPAKVPPAKSAAEEPKPGPAAIRDEIQQGIEELARRSGMAPEEWLKKCSFFESPNKKTGIVEPHFCIRVSELTDKWAGSTLGRVREELKKKPGREPGDE